MKDFPVQICLLLIIILFNGPVFPSGSPGEFDRNIRNDSTLIVPGRGAEKLMIDDTLARVMDVYGHPGRVARFKEKKDLFKDVFRVSGEIRVSYNKILYYENQGVIVLLLENAVCAIIGLNNFRITSEAVNLRQGAEYFIFIYGNIGLTKLKKGNNTIYMYREMGIILVDDHNDDSINMYVLVKPW